MAYNYQRSPDDPDNRAYIEQTYRDKEAKDLAHRQAMTASTDAVRLSRTNDMLAATRASRNQDMAEGRKRGEELFGEGKLGRVAVGRSDQMKDVIARRQAFLNGYSPAEMSSMRDSFTEGNDRSVEMNLRRLRGVNANAGVRGPAAAAQSARALAEGSDREAVNEREIFTKNAAEKRAGLEGYEKTLGAVEGQEQANEKFNLGQMLKERFGVAGSEMGFAGLGAGERGQVLQQILSEDQASATVKAAEAGGKK